MSESQLDSIEQQRVLSATLLEKIMDSDDGINKEASASGTAVLRRRIREAGIFRQIIKPRQATDADLTRVSTHDNPVIVRNFEPDSKGAVSVPFGTALDAEFFWSNAYESRFFRIDTPEFFKDENQLRVLKYDLIKMIQDNSLMDIQKREDFHAFAIVDEIVGELDGIGAAGYTQNHRILGDLNKQTYATILNGLEDNELNNGVVVMNRHTSKKFLTNWNADDFGFELAGDAFKNGMGAFTKNIHGLPHIFTIKQGLIPNNVVYIFTQENFLGNFDILEDPKLFVKKEKGIISFSAQETIAITLANVAGVHRYEFAAG